MDHRSPADAPESRYQLTRHRQQIISRITSRWYVDDNQKLCRIRFHFVALQSVPVSDLIRAEKDQPFRTITRVTHSPESFSFNGTICQLFPFVERRARCCEDNDGDGRYGCSTGEAEAWGGFFVTKYQKFDFFKRITSQDFVGQEVDHQPSDSDNLPLHFSYVNGKLISEITGHDYTRDPPQSPPRADGLMSSSGGGTGQWWPNPITLI